MYFRQLCCLMLHLLLWHPVTGDSVVIQQPGDRLTLSVENTIDWDENWKFCLSMGEIDPVTGDDTAEILMMMGSQEGEVIEKLGLGVVSTAPDITTVEVVQTKRNVTSGIIDIWISEETLDADNSFETCIEHNEADTSQWTATLQSEDGNVTPSSIGVNKSIDFHPTNASTEITVEKLDSITSHHITDVSVQTDCKSSAAVYSQSLCRSHEVSLQHHDNVHLTGNTTQLYATSYCTGAGIRIDRSTGDLNQEILLTSLAPVHQPEFPFTMCSNFFYENLHSGSAMIYIRNYDGDLLLEFLLSPDSLAVLPYGTNTEYTPPYGVNGTWHTFCVEWEGESISTVFDGEEPGAEMVSISNVFTSSNTLKISATLSDSVNDDFFFLLSDLNVFDSISGYYHSLVCDSHINTHTSFQNNMLNSWMSRVISSDEDFQVTSRPTFHRTLTETVTGPLMSCQTRSFLSNDIVNVSKLYAIDVCYHMPGQCDVILSDATLYTPFSHDTCYSTDATELTQLDGYIQIGNVETQMPGEMMYTGYAYVLPAVSYLNDEANFHVTDNGTSCLELFPPYSWSVITYNAISKICSYYSSPHQLQTDLVVNDYYSSIYLPVIDNHLQILEDFHNDTQQAFTMSYSICINASSVEVIWNTTLVNCAWECLVRAECISFQATAYDRTDCALFPQSYICGVDGSSEITGIIWGQPYLRRFHKKYCESGYTLMVGQCVKPVNTTSAAGVSTYTVFSLIELQAAAAFIGDIANYNSIDVQLSLISKEYPSCQTPELPGFYYLTTNHFWEYCSKGSQYAIFFPGSFLLPLAVLIDEQNNSVPVHTDSDVSGINPLLYYPYDNPLTTAPLSSWGFHQTIFNSSRLPLTHTTAFTPQEFINTVHVHAWLCYRKFVSQDTSWMEGTVLQIGEAFKLTVHWSDATQTVEYSLSVGSVGNGSGSASASPITVGPSTSLLKPDTWYLVEAYTTEGLTYLRIRDENNTMIYNHTTDIGLTSNRFKRSETEAVLKFRGQLTCMYVFYKDSPLTVNGSINLCADSGYMFADEDEYYNPEVESLHTVNLKVNGRITQQIDPDALSIDVINATEVTKLCTGNVHTTTTMIQSLTAFPLSSLQLMDSSIRDFSYLTSNNDTDDRFVCKVSEGASRDGVECWTVEDLSVDQQPNYSGLCTDCTYLLVTRRKARTTTNKNLISTSDGGTEYRRKDCLDYCTCAHDHWIELYVEQSIPSIDDLPAEECKCKYALDDVIIPDLHNGTRECEELCPHWERDPTLVSSLAANYERICNCESGQLTEYRKCVEPTVTVSATLNGGCHVDEHKSVNSTMNCAPSYCPALVPFQSVCNCTSLSQVDERYCNVPLQNDASMGLLNASCVEEYYWDVTYFQITDNNCSTICPAAEERPCCVDNVDVLTNVCRHDSTSINGIELVNFNCTPAANCNTDCLDVLYEVDCTNFHVTSNVTGYWRTHTDTLVNPTPQVVCSSPCNSYINWIRSNCPEAITTSTSATTTTTTQSPTTTTANPTTTTVSDTSTMATATGSSLTTTSIVTVVTTNAYTTTMDAPTVSSSPATTTTASPTSTATTASPTSTATTASPTSTATTASSDAVIPTTSTSAASAVTTNLPTTTTATTAATTSSAVATNIITNTITNIPTAADISTTAISTTVPTTTTVLSTTTTTLPVEYESCNCTDGRVHSVSGSSRSLQHGQNCLSSCPYWSNWTEYCFCSSTPALQYTRTCEQGNNELNYILELPSVCSIEEIQTNVTNTPCGCPWKENVTECDCNYKYGRTGYECIYNHSNPINGECTTKDIYPFACGDLCSSYDSWSSWTSCTPCDIGTLEGTHNRSRDCMLPSSYSDNTDYKGTQQCNSTEEVIETCDCGYKWSEWSSCDCSTGNRERNRCWDRYPLSTTTTTTTTVPATTTVAATTTTLPAAAATTIHAANSTVNSAASSTTTPAVSSQTTTTSTTTTTTSTASPTATSTSTRTTGAPTATTSPIAATSTTNSTTPSTVGSSAESNLEIMETTNAGLDMSSTSESTVDPSTTTTTTAVTTTHPSQQSWCIEQEPCQQFCPFYSDEWGSWEPCNCMKRRRYQECLYPPNPNDVALVPNTTECTEPKPDYKDCETTGCYSDWTTWSQCDCSTSRSNRTRYCMEDSCSGPFIQYEACKLEDMQCWFPWTEWDTCRRVDDNCGRGGSTSRTRTADCTNAVHLSDICSDRIETDINTDCIAFTCTKYGLWGEWDEWAEVKRCGVSNQTRTRDCQYSYRSIDSWRESTCDLDCWQCIVEETDRRCFERACLKSCKLADVEPPTDFDLTVKCADPLGSGDLVDNEDKQKRLVECGSGNVWSEWTACGISCGFQWGKQYRSQTCNLNEDEQISETCKNVLFLQVQPQWCFVSQKCPDVKVVPTLIPEEQKAKNLPAVESEEGVYVASSLGLIIVGIIILIVVLDVPSIVLQLNARLVANIKSACGRSDGADLVDISAEAAGGAK